MQESHMVPVVQLQSAFMIPTGPLTSPLLLFLLFHLICTISLYFSSALKWSCCFALSAHRHHRIMTYPITQNKSHPLSLGLSHFFLSPLVLVYLLDQATKPSISFFLFTPPIDLLNQISVVVVVMFVVSLSRSFTLMILIGYIIESWLVW